MKKLFLSFLLTLSFAICSYAQDGKLKFLAVNDIHSHIEYFPQLAFIVDSIRAICPDLQLVSGGDNRTGNPWNDMAAEPNLPMVELMNTLGFNMSVMGNHECDESQASFANTVNKSRFPYLVANMYAHDTLAIHTTPFKFIKINDLRVAVLGLVGLGPLGIPDCHPDRVTGIHFTNPLKEAKRYSWLRNECDVYILLSHLGKKEEIKLAKEHPEFDLIIGGHSHDLVPGEKHNGVFITQALSYTKEHPEFDLIIGGHSHDLVSGEKHNGVFITQALSYTEFVNEIDITVKDGKVKDITCKPISIKAATGVNEKVEAMVSDYANHPEFKRVLTTAVNPFKTKEELGYMMTDAIRRETEVDIVLQNVGGIRISSMPAGDISVEKILSIDPFRNTVFVYELTGAQVLKLLEDQPRSFVSGIRHYVKKSRGKYTFTISRVNGKRFNKKKRYRVATNNFVASVSKVLKPLPYTDLNTTTTDYVISYLEKQESVNYKGKKCLVLKR
ncbi:MAG: bifunctional metallophosphatase/5'-nucleotidase [Prevotella sp.]|nr:bifunctional metallophosphatase/5'-nucleotidase [Prevotella sp.]